jgi:hypothetical protein
MIGRASATRWPRRRDDDSTHRDECIVFGVPGELPQTEATKPVQQRVGRQAFPPVGARGPREAQHEHVLPAAPRSWHQSQLACLGWAVGFTYEGATAVPEECLPS